MPKTIQLEVLPSKHEADPRSFFVSALLLGDLAIADNGSIFLVDSVNIHTLEESDTLYGYFLGVAPKRLGKRDRVRYAQAIQSLGSEHWSKPLKDIRGVSMPPKVRAFIAAVAEAEANKSLKRQPYALADILQQFNVRVARGKGSLRSQVVKLAHDKPELRPYLLPLLKQ